MLRLDVQHDAVLRAKVYQRPVAFIPLGNEELAVGIPVRVRSQNRNLRPHVMRGFQSTLPQHMRRQRGCRRFAMSARHDHALLGLHHRRQGFRATDQRNARLERRLVGHVSRLDGAGVNHHVAVLHLLFGMRAVKAEAHLQQPIHLHRRHPVRATHLVPQCQQQRRQPTHARASHADQIDPNGMTAFLEETENGLIHGK